MYTYVYMYICIYIYVYACIHMYIFRICKRAANGGRERHRTPRGVEGQGFGFRLCVCAWVRGCVCVCVCVCACVCALYPVADTRRQAAHGGRERHRTPR